MFNPKEGKTLRLILQSSLLLLGCGSAVGFWISLSDRHEVITSVYFIADSQPLVVVPMASPTCRIQFLTKEERLTAPVLKLPPNAIKIPLPDLPAEEFENPVLYRNRYAIIRFDNHMTHDLVFYTAVWHLDYYQECQSIKLPTDRPITGIPSVVSSGFLVRVEVQDEKGDLLTGDYAPWDSLESLGPPHLPTVGDLKSDNYTTVALRAGEGIDLPMSILGRVICPQRGLKPGLYTIRATVSYAEAPYGDAKHVVSEPVNMRVTLEHMKAVETYFESRRRVK
jgi:hypothetical protein